LWNAADGAELKNFAGHGGAIVAVAFTGNNQRVISASADQTVRTWNPADGQQVSAIPAGAPATALALARDDNRIAVGCADNSVKLFQISDGKALATLAGHAAPIGSLAFSADMTRLVSGGANERSFGTWPAARSSKVSRSTAGSASASTAQRRTTC